MKGDVEVDLRPQPSNVDAEMALLGILIFDRDAWGAIAERQLQPHHFFEPTHQRIFDTIGDMIRAGTPADPVLLAQRLGDDQGFHGLGGAGYLADLLDRAPPPSSIMHYADAVYDMAARRGLVGVSRQIAMLGRDMTLSASDATTSAERMMRDLAHGFEPNEAKLTDARSSALATLDQIDEETQAGKPKGKMTGLRCFDRRLRGLRPGHLIIIGGRPSMGKTGQARQAAFGCASRNPNHLVAFFSLEMERRELDERTLSQLSHEADMAVPYQEMAGAKLEPMVRHQLRELSWKVPKNLMIDDTASVSADYIERRVWALKRKGDLAAVFIDYLQLMAVGERNGRNDAALIGEITSRLKRLARAAEIAVVLLSQINRGVEQREDKRPQLSDLRESGSIEQDANAVLFPYREVYYVERAEPKEGTAEHAAWGTNIELIRRRMDVICAKNRGGAVGTDRQEYIAECDLVRDLHGEYD